MPSTYNGNAANVSRPASLNISSSTNASPIAMVFTSPHGLATGDVLAITGHQGNPAANGRQTVTVTGPSSVTLNGTTGVGVGTATGTAQALWSPENFQIPSPGDPRSAAGVNTPSEAIADRVSYTAARVLGGYQLVGYYQINPSGSWSPSSAPAQLTSWTDTAFTTGHSFLLASLSPLSIGPTDLIEVEVAAQVSLAVASADAGYLRLDYAINGGAIAPNTPTPATAQALSTTSAAYWVKHYMRDFLVPATLGQPYSLNLYITGAVGLNTSTLRLFANTHGLIKVYRPT